MKLLDVNILVQAHRADADKHRDVKAWLEEQLRMGPRIVVSHLVLSGFLRIVTHPRVFKNPTPLENALGFVEDFTGRKSVGLVQPGEKHWAIFLNLCREGEVKGNLIPDAYHAALAIEYGMEWITLDRGFARFPELRWSCPV